MNRIYSLLQMNGGTFPTGGFSQSFGLETYVAEGIVHDAETFSQFLETYLCCCVGKCEGPIIIRAFELAGDMLSGCDVMDELAELEVLSNASKVTLESREAGLRMGKAFCRIMSEVLQNDTFDSVIKRIGRDISYPVAYGFVCGIMDIDLEDVVNGYIYSTANTLVQSAVKLIPLGNTEAQIVLHQAAEEMSKTLELAVRTSIDDITNFCPGLDIAGIRHETLPVRLYMS